MLFPLCSLDFFFINLLVRYAGLCVVSHLQYIFFSCHFSFPRAAAFNNHSDVMLILGIAHVWFIPLKISSVRRTSTFFKYVIISRTNLENVYVCFFLSACHMRFQIMAQKCRWSLLHMQSTFFFTDPSVFMWECNAWNCWCKIRCLVQQLDYNIHKYRWKKLRRKE